MVKPAQHSCATDIQGAERYAIPILRRPAGRRRSDLCTRTCSDDRNWGAAIDYSRANAARAAMQATLDATALMVAKDAQIIQPTQVNSTATSYFNAAFNRPEVQSLQVTASMGSGSGGTVITASVTGSVSTTFMQVLGQSSMSVAARTSVVNASDGLGCVLSLTRSSSCSPTA